jgi:uncharacterized protein (TIGR02145 family)
MKTAKLFLSPLRWAKSRRDGTLLTVCFRLRAFSLRTILLPALLFFFCANLSAQVTIGGLEEPHKGSVLDLNSTTKGGLLLSNVVLENLYAIPTTFPGMSSPPDDANEKFTGALVYHEGGNGIPAGIYVWNGENWSPATENCTVPALTLNVPPFVKKETPVILSVASDASARCAEGETYKWYQTAAPDNDTYGNSFGTTASVTTSFADEGDYKIKVEAKSPYSSAIIEEEKDVTVTADGEPDPYTLTYTYGIVGETCLDVKNSDQGKSPEAFTARKDAFVGGYAKTYRFLHGNDYRGLTLFLDDPNHLVAGITYPPADADGVGEKEFTLTFKSNVKNLVPANGDSMTVKLYASYKPQEAPTVIKYAYLEIRVEDGTCVCPVKKSATEWLNLMCHNLGGLDIISTSQLLTYEHHGDWYRFGAKTPSLENDGTSNGASGWTFGSLGSTPPYYAPETGYAIHNSSWDWPDDLDSEIGNPCPAGWRVLTLSDWSVINTNLNIPVNIPVTKTGWVIDNTVFSNLKKYGDYLMLPAAGGRTSSGGLNNRAQNGHYWLSDTHSDNNQGKYVSFNFGSSTLSYYDRSSAFSIRCVEAE